MANVYDTIIVGAGPAGGTAAFFLGQAGQRVLVLEKENLPRYKTCGGGLSVNVLKQFPFSFEPVLERRVKSVRYALGDQVVTIPVPGDSICTVMRDRFDAYILEHATAQVRQWTAVKSVEEGLDGVRVETANGEHFESRCLVAADGANSVVARCVGLRRKKNMAAAIEAETRVPAEIMAKYAEMPLLVFGEVDHGYVWIFPKSDHLSIGVGGMHPGPGELQKTLREVMLRYGISLEASSIHGHPVPIFQGWERVATKRVLLAGDAAGLVDPFTGEGIRFAIHSGWLAAEAILRDRVNKYPQWVNRRIKLNHAVGVPLADSFFAMPRAWFTLAVRNPYATRAFVDMISGRSGYPKVALRLVGSLPVYLLTELMKRSIRREALHVE